MNFTERAREFSTLNVTFSKRPEDATDHSKNKQCTQEIIGAF